MTTKPDLPRIIQFLGVYDSGEFGNASCPHCGAQGRYVQNFIVEGGARRGAMAGCVKLFPVSPIATAHQKLLMKERDYVKKDWSLPSWDLAKLAAIEAFYAGTLTEQDAMTEIRRQEQRAADYRARKSGKRAFR